VPVRGAALTVNVGAYPTDQPARCGSAAAAARLGTALDSGGYQLELRLADPDPAESFAAAHPEVNDTSQESKSESAQDLEDLAAVLVTLAIFVVGLTIATAGILVAGRMVAQIRQVGTLKAVGVTPGQVTCVLLVEYLAVAFRVGLAAGTLLAPPLARLTRVLSVYGAQAPPITWPRAAIVVAVVTSVVLFATVRPALRGDTARCAPWAAAPGHRTSPAGLSGRSTGCRCRCGSGSGCALHHVHPRRNPRPIGLSPLTYVATVLTALVVCAAIAVTPPDSSPDDASRHNSRTIRRELRPRRIDGLGRAGVPTVSASGIVWGPRGAVRLPR
jgi:FtsX-like permease family